MHFARGIFSGQSDELVSKLVSRIPMGRMAKEDEYLGAIQFLCSDASRYMNGAVLVIDGGRLVGNSSGKIFFLYNLKK